MMAGDFSFSEWAKIDADRPSTFDSFMSGAKAGQEFQANIDTNAAMRALQANPNDQSALTMLARHNPQAANQIMVASELDRQQKGRAATVDYYKATEAARLVRTARPPIAQNQPMVQQSPSPISTTSGQSILTPLPAVAQPMRDDSHIMAMAGKYSNLTPQPTALNPVEAPVEKTVADYDHPISVEIGKAVTDGQVSVADAGERMLSILSPTELKSALGAVAELDEPRREMLILSSKAIGEAAYTMIQNIPDDGGRNQARRDYVQSIKPRLLAVGITEEQIDGFDYNNTSLHGLITQSIGIVAMDKRISDERDYRFKVAEEARKDGEVVSSPYDGTLYKKYGGDVVRDPFANEAGGPSSNNIAPSASATGPAGNGVSYRDPRYDSAENAAGARFGVPPELIRSIRINGERSNANQVSSAGARGVYQFIPSTRAAIMKQTGIDAWASPEQASMAAAYLLKQNMDRNGGDMSLAVREYHGGPDRSKWGPINRDYVARVMNNGRPASGQANASNGRLSPLRPNSDLSVAEKSSRNLDPAKAYRTDRYGKIYFVGGQAPAAKPIQMSAKARSDYAANAALITKFDEALSMVQTNKESFGLQNYAGDTIMSRYDKKGVSARAMVSGISALKVHDLSGAAVSIKEFERLKPYIPNLTDTYDTIIKKLGLLRREMTVHMRETAKAWGADGNPMQRAQNTPSQNHINTLKNNPSEGSQASFDRRYGAGAAKRVLGS